MKNIRVGVLRGGPSNEYGTSLKTGSSVLKNLPEGAIGVDIFIGRDGAWHVGGVPAKEGEVLSRVDVVWNALHGVYGEDGKVQRMLEMFGTPYTGSKPHPSLVGMNKALTKELLKGAGVRMPQHALFCPREESVIDAARKIFETSAPPWIIKPIGGGSSIGIVLAHTFSDLASTLSAIAENPSDSDVYIVEEYVRGMEASVGVIDGFRGEDTYILPPIEIRLPTQSPFFDQEAKYSGITEEICPGNFIKSEKEMLMNAAKKVHEVLGLRHYSRSDFIVSPHGVYFLEANTLPGLTEESLFPKALHAVGSSLAQFIEHTLSRAMQRN